MKKKKYKKVWNCHFGVSHEFGCPHQGWRFNLLDAQIKEFIAKVEKYNALKI